MFFIFFPITAFFIWLHFAKALLAIDTTLYLCPFILIKAGILTFIIFFPALIALTVLALLLLFHGQRIDIICAYLQRHGVKPPFLFCLILQV